MKLEKINARGADYLFRDPVTKIIYFKAERKGKGRLVKSCRTTVLEEAKPIGDDLLKRFLGVSRIKRGRKLVGELFAAWMDEKSLKRKATRDSIANSWRHLAPYCADMLPEEITASWWTGVYIPQKRAEVRVIKRKDGSERHIPQTDRKFFNDLKWLRMFLLSLKREGILEKLPRLEDPHADDEERVGKVFSEDEVDRLLLHSEGDLELQILMAVTMGMRVGEIMKMSWDRIDMTERTFHLRKQDTKTKKARTFGISDEVYRILRLRERQIGPLFSKPDDPTVSQGRQGNRTAWANCKSKAGVEGRFHDLRHTFLTRAFKSFGNPALICFYAGLSLEEAQRTYLHLTHEDTRVVAGLVSPYKAS